MSPPRTTLRIGAYPQLEDEQAHTRPTKPNPEPVQPCRVFPRPVDVGDLDFEAIPTRPALELEMAYHRTLAAEDSAEPVRAGSTTGRSHEAWTQWRPAELDRTVVLPPERASEVDLDVDVVPAMTSDAWDRRLEPLSVELGLDALEEPAPHQTAPPRPRWPLYLAAALCGSAVGVALWLGVQALV